MVKSEQGHNSGSNRSSRHGNGRIYFEGVTWDWEIWNAHEPTALPFHCRHLYLNMKLRVNSSNCRHLFYLSPTFSTTFNIHTGYFTTPTDDATDTTTKTCSVITRSGRNEITVYYWFIMSFIASNMSSIFFKWPPDPGLVFLLIRIILLSTRHTPICLSWWIEFEPGYFPCFFFTFLLIDLSLECFCSSSPFSFVSLIHSLCLSLSRPTHVRLSWSGKSYPYGPAFDGGPVPCAYDELSWWLSVYWTSPSWVHDGCHKYSPQVSTFDTGLLCKSSSCMRW